MSVCEIVARLSQTLEPLFLAAEQCAIIADTLGKPVCLIEERDTSAAGAALLGRAAVEQAPLREIADSACAISARFEPSPNRSMIEVAIEGYRKHVAMLLC